MKALLQRLKESLRKYSWYRWCEANDLKALLNKARGLKQKLSHDNLFDIAFGAILALIGLSLYRYVDWAKLSIIIVPFLVSWFNELVNSIQSHRFGWIDLVLRCLIGIILYLIII